MERALLIVVSMLVPALAAIAYARLIRRRQAARRASERALRRAERERIWAEVVGPRSSDRPAEPN